LPLKLVAATGEPSIEVSPGRVLVVGRSLSCDLPLRDPTVSRHHAEVRLAQSLDGGGEETGVWVRDLGSTNGTFVDGARVSEAVLARPGARVTFGKVELRLAAARPPVPATDDEPSSASALEATILRQVRVHGPGDVAAQLADAPQGGSHLRIAGRSAEDRQARKLQLLIDIAKELAQQTEIDPLLDKVVRLTFQVLQADRVAILTGAEADALVPRVWKSAGQEPAERWHVPRSVARKAVADRVAVLVQNAENPDSPARSALCAPLLGSQGKLLGALYLDEQRGDASFSEEDLEFLTAFSGMVAIALENSQLVGRARREAVVLSNFQRYFAPDLAEQIAGQDEEIQLGGSKRRVVVLFSDIRGFTSISEAMSPDEIAQLLTEYFTEMVEIVFEHGGTLDKFMGDALMALWGAPLGRADDADRATRAAVAMQRGLERLNWEWLREGRQTISAGIGIGVGEVFAGNIGSDRRLEYTVIGDAVNTASRLCSEAGPGEILVTEELYRELTTPPRVQPLQPLPLRGKAQPVPVYRVEWGAGSGLTQPLGGTDNGNVTKEETQRWSSPKP
jgi:adenylate cyclase